VSGNRPLWLGGDFVESQGDRAGWFFVECAVWCLGGMVLCHWLRGPEWVHKALVVMTVGFALTACIEAARAVCATRRKG
jgi:hypothetical protein